MGGKPSPEMLHQGITQFSSIRLIHNTWANIIPYFWTKKKKKHICCLHESVLREPERWPWNLLTGLAGLKLLTHCSLGVKRTRSPTKSGKIQQLDDAMYKLGMTVMTQLLYIKVYGSIDSYMGNIKRRLTGRHVRDLEKWAYVNRKAKQENRIVIFIFILMQKRWIIFLMFLFFSFSKAVKSKINWIHWRGWTVTMIPICNLPESALPHPPSGQSHQAGMSNTVLQDLWYICFAISH